jgi:hypothetical protein
MKLEIPKWLVADLVDVIPTNECISSAIEVRQDLIDSGSEPTSVEIGDDGSIIFHFPIRDNTLSTQVILPDGSTDDREFDVMPHGKEGRPRTGDTDAQRPWRCADR